MWFFQRRSHTLISQQEQQHGQPGNVDYDEEQSQQDEEEQSQQDENHPNHNHRHDDHEVTLDPSSSQTSLGQRNHNQDPENIELTHHYHNNDNDEEQSSQQEQSNQEFQDHPSDMTLDNNNTDPWQEQLKYSYERKTFLCNVFTIFVLFQMWMGWNDNPAASSSSSTSTNGDNGTSSTVQGIIVTTLFSLLVIGINIQVRHFYHEQWQEQSTQIFSLLPNTTATNTNADSTDDNETHPHDLELQSPSLSSRQTQRQPQPQQTRFVTWDDILHLSQQRNGTNNNHTHHVDLSMLSYQAQLAYAIMESQRYIIETGGYGNPDGPEHKEGVSMETIQSWKTFAFHPMVGGAIDTMNSSKATSSSTKPSWDKEGPTCCICLCEYETNEELKEITPCGHWYHSDCILGWVKHHTTCPLCQVELE